MTHRGPFQPLLFCDSVILGHGSLSPSKTLSLVPKQGREEEAESGEGQK